MKTIKAPLKGSTEERNPYYDWISERPIPCSWKFGMMKIGYCMVITFDDDEDATAFKLAFRL